MVAKQWRVQYKCRFRSSVLGKVIYCPSMESIRLGGPAHGIVTKTVHKTMPGVVGVKGWVGKVVVGFKGVGGVQGVVGYRVGVQGVMGYKGGGAPGGRWVGNGGGPGVAGQQWWGSRGGWVRGWWGSRDG